jgi:hydrophobe/amphiphile efflux-3 (HAE3) family protein
MKETSGSRSLTLRLFTFSQRHPLLIIVVTALITAVLGYFATQVQIRSEIEDLIPKDEEMTQLIRKYRGEGTDTNYLMLAVEREDPFDPEALKAFAGAIGRIGEIPGIETVIHPFNIVSFSKRGNKLEILPPAKEPPQKQEDLARFRERLSNDPIAQGLLISNDGKILSALFATDTLEDGRAEMRAFQRIAASLEQYYKVYSTGVALATFKGTQYVARDLPRLLALTAAFILLIYYLGFRSVRAVALPMVVVGLGTIWTVGFMSILGYGITMVSIATPPLVLTLGSSYSIHILNQYYREGAHKNGKGHWIVLSVSHIQRTIFLASATTVIGFASLLATRTSQIREFGLSTSLGIISCALLSLFFLPTVLSLLKPPALGQTRRVLRGGLHRMMQGLSRFTLSHPIPILSGVVAIAIVFGLSVNRIGHQYDYFAYFPKNEKLVQDTKYLAESLGGLQQLNFTLAAPNGEKNYFLSRDVLEKVDLFERELLDNPYVMNTISFTSYLKHLNRVMTGQYSIPETRGLTLLLARYIRAISTIQSGDNSFLNVIANEDFSQLTITFRVYNLEKAHYLFEDELKVLVEQIYRDSERLLPSELKGELWGNSLRFLSVSRIVNRDQRVSLLISFLLIFAMTSIAFRSLFYGFCSLFPLMTGIIINFIVMALFKIPLDMTTVMISNIAVGVGVDNSIHLLLQFRRQKKIHPDDIPKVFENTLTITGRPILLTSASIVGGLLILVFASFVPIVYFGILVSLTLFATAVGSLVVLPVILSLAMTWSRKRAAGKNKEVDANGSKRSR